MTACACVTVLIRVSLAFRSCRDNDSESKGSEEAGCLPNDSSRHVEGTREQSVRRLRRKRQEEAKEKRGEGTRPSSSSFTSVFLRFLLFLGPRWASWNIGVYVCIRCAGIHRNLGVHISKVKSVNLDTWTEEQIEVARFPYPSLSFTITLRAFRRKETAL